MDERKTSFTVAELQSFIGLYNAFRNIFSNFARIALPLSRSLKKTRAKDLKHLEEDELQALDIPKGKLISPPILFFPKRNARFTFYTDACDKQVECVVLQYQPDGKTTRPIGYSSRTLTEQEKTWPLHGANVSQ